MTDINHGERQLIPQGLQIGRYLLAPVSVERGERLIEQQEPRLREQGAADGDALFFASGQLMNAARHERLQVEHADYAIESDMAGACRASFCKFEVSADVQMWKQPGVLKDISDTSFLDRYVDTQFAVEEDGVIEHHAPAVGMDQAGDDVDGGGLAAPGRAEQRDHAGCRRLEPHIEVERPALLGGGYREHQRPSIRRTRRANHSATNRPPKPSVTDST